jgi:type III restriction enzyme
VLRIDVVVRPVLAVYWAKVETLKLGPAQTPISAEIAPAPGGAIDWNMIQAVSSE